MLWSEDNRQKVNFSSEALDAWSLEDKFSFMWVYTSDVGKCAAFIGDSVVARTVPGGR